MIGKSRDVERGPRMARMTRMEWTPAVADRRRRTRSLPARRTPFGMIGRARPTAPGVFTISPTRPIRVTGLQAPMRVPTCRPVSRMRPFILVFPAGDLRRSSTRSKPFWLLNPRLSFLGPGMMRDHCLRGYDHLNPMPFEAATRMEMDLAEDLRRAGFTVKGGISAIANS